MLTLIIFIVVIFATIMIWINRANIINIVSFLGNFIIWCILQNGKSNFVSTDKKVLYIPCDPRNVWGSRGDEAMIYSSLKILEEKYNINNFYFITATEKAQKELDDKGYKGIYAWKGLFSIYHIYKAIMLLKPSHIVIIGADCMDGYYNKNVSFILMAIASLCQKHCISYNLLGFSFNSKPSFLLKLCYHFCSSEVIFNIRDYYSLQSFKKFTSKKARLVADMAFLLEPNSNFEEYKIYHDWFKEQKKMNKIIIGFNFHPMLKKKQNMNEINSACMQLANMLIQILQMHKDCSFIFIPHANRAKLSDTVVLPIIANLIRAHGYEQRILEIKDVYHADQIKAIIKFCDATICSRMHLAIAALSSNIPVMAATYQDKFQGLFKHYDLSPSLLLSPSEFLSPKFVITFEQLLTNRTKIMEALIKKQEYIRSLSALNISIT